MQPSERQQKQEERDIFSFVERMGFFINAPFFAWNSAEYLIEVNQNLSQLIGEDRIRLVGKDVYNLFSKEYAVKVRELIGDPGDVTWDQEIIIPVRQKTGQLREILWTPARIPDSSDRTVATICQGLDITEQKWAIDYLNRYISELTRKNDELEGMRARLQLHNRNLDENVRKRTREIEELLKQKDEFISQISHDLKTPLTPILALTPTLLKKETDPKKKRHLETIERNATHLHTLLTGIIRYAYLNKRYMPRRGIELSVYQMIEELVITAESKILKKHLQIENQIPRQIKLEINPLDFDTIFGNLLDNAIKFTGKDGIIRVSGEESDGEIRITMTDTGIGMDPLEMRRIFNPFYKADLSRHHLQSQGLGLSVTKDMVEQNGGTITVESQGKGRGSSFIITFRQENRSGGKEKEPQDEVWDDMNEE
jgi:PAS domain S-box-containing protein